MITAAVVVVIAVAASYLPDAVTAVRRLVRRSGQAINRANRPCARDDS